MNHYSLAPANFLDYRDFLKNRFEEVQSSNKRYSLQACADKAGISKSLLQFLFQKKRHLSLEKIPGLARALKLSSDEEYFVYLMLCQNSTKNASVREHFEQVMSRVRAQYVRTENAPPPEARENEKALYLNSLFMILQKLIRLPDFREDVDWIAENLIIPDINTTQIRTTLAELEKLGFVTRDPSGRLQAKDETLWRPDPYDPSGQSVFTVGAETAARLMQRPEIYKPSVYMSMALAFDEVNLLSAEKFMIEVHHKLTALSRQSRRPTAVSFIGNFFLTVFRQK